MHKQPQTESYLGSSGQTLTTNVSMTLCDSQVRHQTHVLCGYTTFGTELHYVWYRIKIRSEINTVPTPTVAWTRA